MLEAISISYIDHPRIYMGHMDGLIIHHPVSSFYHHWFDESTIYLSKMSCSPFGYKGLRLMVSDLIQINDLTLNKYDLSIRTCVKTSDQCRGIGASLLKRGVYMAVSILRRPAMSLSWLRTVFNRVLG
jgi:hypothetical protein